MHSMCAQRKKAGKNTICLCIRGKRKEVKKFSEFVHLLYVSALDLIYVIITNEKI